MTTLLHAIEIGGYLLGAWGFWLLIDRGTRSPASHTAARVMHPSNGEARRLPERRATPERVDELNEWMEGRG